MNIMHLISVSKLSDNAFIMVSDFYGVLELDPAFVPAYYTTKALNWWAWIDPYSKGLVLIGRVCFGYVSGKFLKLAG